MHLSPMPTLDAHDLARATINQTSRNWLGPLIGLGAVAVLGAGFGTYKLLAHGAGSRAQSVRFGSVVDMPEIKDGVPALMAAKPARVIALAPPEPARPAAVSLPSRPAAAELMAAIAVQPSGSAPARSDPLREEADAKAMAATVATAFLRPGLAGPARASVPGPSGGEESGPAEAAPVATQPSQATLSVARPAILSDAPPTRPALGPDAVAAARPDSSSTADAIPAASARPPAGPATASPESARAAPRLPPVRPATRSAELQQERIAGPRPRTMPAPGPSTANPPVERSPMQPPRADERAEIFGLPLPGFVPTGRQIREAAGNIVDAVVSLPDRF